MSATSLRSAPVRSLFVLNSLCVGGAEKQVVALLNGLAALPRHEAWLQCLKDDDALLPHLQPAAAARILPGLRVRSGLQPFAVAALARRIDELGIEVLVCTNMYALLYGSLARAMCRRRREVRLVEVFHTTDVGSRKEQLSMTLYRRLVRGADLLVYVCHAQAEHWRHRGLQARREAVIHNGVDTDRFTDRGCDEDKRALRRSLGLEPDGVVVGLCAVMRPEKAHGDLLQAIALLRARGVQLAAMLIGDGPERPVIEAKIDALGLRDAVRITGLVQDVRPYIAACDAMVLASHAVETFSIAALEAMSLGKPMVMTRIGGAQEQVRDGTDGRLYPCGDVQALAAVLAEMADRSLCRQMGARAARTVRACFGIDRMVCDYAAALESVAASDAAATASRLVTPTP